MTADLITRGILKSLILPPGVFVLLLLLALMTWRTTISRLLILITAVSIYLLSTGFGAGRLAAGIEVYPPTDAAKLAAQQVEAIVVPMAGRQAMAPEFGADTVDRYSMDRIAYAARLARETGLPIVLSGGAHEAGHTPIAQLGAEVLANQFQIQSLALETDSKNTWENAHYSAILLKQRQIKKIAVVTHAWHMPRTLYSFAQAGVDAVAAPTNFIHRDEPIERKDWIPNAYKLNDSAHVIHEYIGLLWYRKTLGAD